MWNYGQVEHLAICSKMQLARFLIGGLVFLSTVWTEIHAYSLNGVHLIYMIRQTVKLKPLPNIPHIRYINAY